VTGWSWRKERNPATQVTFKPVRTTSRIHSFYRPFAEIFKCYLLTGCRCKDRTQPINADSSERCSYIMTDDEVRSQGMTYLEEIMMVLIKGRMYRLVHKRHHKFYNC